MKFNQVSYDNFPETGELVWFAGLGDWPKRWIPAVFLGPVDDGYIDNHGHTHYVKAMIDGKISNRCSIGRFHRGDTPPDEGEAWE